MTSCLLVDEPDSTVVQKVACQPSGPRERKGKKKLFVFSGFHVPGLQVLSPFCCKEAGRAGEKRPGPRPGPRPDATAAVVAS